MNNFSKPNTTRNYTGYGKSGYGRDPGDIM